MQKEIRRQIAEHDKEYWLDMDACVLWVLHARFGFGATRLKRFFDAFSEEHKRLSEKYQMDDDTRFLCRYLLKQDLGINVEDWEAEALKNTEDSTHDNQ